MPTHSSAGAEAERERVGLLRACSILAGQTPVVVQPPSSSTATTGEQGDDHKDVDRTRSSSKLARLLNARLVEFKRELRSLGINESVVQAGDDDQEGSAVFEDKNEDEEQRCKALTAEYALRALLRLSDLEGASIREEKRQTTTTTPLFGIKDTKTIQILVSLVSRWGLASLLPRSVLPSEFNDDSDERRRPDHSTTRQSESHLHFLKDLVRQCLRLIHLDDDDAGAALSQLERSELARTSLPQLLLPLVGSLLYLSERGRKASSPSSTENEDSGPWLDHALHRLLHVVSASTAIATLLTLLARASSFSQSTADQTSSASSSSALSSGDKQVSTDNNNRKWLGSAVSQLLAQQLLRPSGVLGLLNVVIGRSEQELQTSQLDQVARVVLTPPHGHASQDCLAIIIPRILQILRPPTSNRAPPPAYFRALCFCLSRIIATQPALAKALLLPYFPIAAPSKDAPPGMHKGKQQQQRGQEGQHDSGSLEEQLDLLSVIVRNIDPSPSNYSFLLDSIVVQLFSCWLFASETKADPVLRQTLENLLNTWGRNVTQVEVLAGLQRVLREADGFKWRRTENGGIASLGFSTSGGVSYLTDSEVGIEEMLAIRPDPELVVNWLKSLDRPAVVTAFLIACLDEIRLLRTSSGSFENQKRSLLRLQLISKIAEECGTEIIKAPSEILSFVEVALDVSSDRQDDDLPLSSSSSPSAAYKGKNPAHSTTGLSMADLRIVDEGRAIDSTTDNENEIPEDDELDVPELSGLLKGEGLLVAALTLLLSVLEGGSVMSQHRLGELRAKLRQTKWLEFYSERKACLGQAGNENLSAANSVQLHNIANRLDALSEDRNSAVVSQLARDAKFVLSSRWRADGIRSTLFGKDHAFGTERDTPELREARAKCREAFQLLQDPVVPIRAQGLAMLRSLVSSATTSSSASTLTTPSSTAAPTARTRSIFDADPGLLPTILDTFVQVVQDDDSFLYLSAVQGLASMVDRFGRDVAGRLVSIYVLGEAGDGTLADTDAKISRGAMGRRELDMRLRVGEALTQVVQKSADALPVYIDILVPGLLHVLWNSKLPVILRSSALTILSECASVSVLALLPHLTNLIGACLDLLSIESAKSRDHTTNKLVLVLDGSGGDASGDGEVASFRALKPKTDETSDPLDTAPTHPALGRGAILFLSQALRALSDKNLRLSSLVGVKKSSGGELVGTDLLERSEIVVGYVGDTDDDALVRHNAQALLQDLQDH